MAKRKDQAEPQKKVSKPKKASKPPKEAPKKGAHKSEEYVVDSEGEDAAPQDRSVKKVLAQPAPIQTNGVGADSEDASGSDREGDKEDEDGSGSEIGSGSEVLPARPSNKPAVKFHGVKRSSAEATSSEDDDDDDDDESDESSAEEQAPAPAAKRQKADDGAARKQRQKKGTLDATGSKKKQSKGGPADESVAQGPIAAKPFSQPAGWSTISFPDTDSSNIINAAISAKKQVWAIAAPASLPLTVIEGLDLDAIQAGQPVLSYKGADYVLSEAATDTENTAVVTCSNDELTAVQRHVTKTFQLQQKIVLPNLSDKQASQMTGSNAAGAVAQAPVASVRPQPKGLRMRYRPPGYGSGDPGWSESDDQEAANDTTQPGQASFQFPRALGAHGPSEEHAKPGAAQHVNGVAEKPRKKQKKRKEGQKDLIQDSAPTSQQTNSETAGAEQPHVNGFTTLAAKKVVAPEAMENGDVTMMDAGATPKETKEEKAKRKEEKRLRKEAKTKAKAG